MRGRSERIIGFELDHRPDDNAHRRERLLERMELREQRGLDAGAGLVVRPKPIAKRLDHVVGGDADRLGPREAEPFTWSIIWSTVCSTPTTAP